MQEFKNIDKLKTLEIVELIAKDLKVGDVICLKGDLGVGKTYFAEKLIQTLSMSNITVTSPTFPIVQIYDGLDCQIWHFDLYRIEDCKSLDEIGIEDALTYAISIIEWPDIALHMLPKNKIEVNIYFAEKSDYRNILIKKGN